VEDHKPLPKLLSLKFEKNKKLQAISRILFPLLKVDGYHLSVGAVTRNNQSAYPPV